MGLDQDVLSRETGYEREVVLRVHFTTYICFYVIDGDQGREVLLLWEGQYYICILLDSLEEFPMMGGKGRGSGVCVAVQLDGLLTPLLITLVQTPMTGKFTLHWCAVSTVSTLRSSCAGSQSSTVSTASC